MKITTMMAAGAALLIGTVPAGIAPASAQRTVVHERTVVRHGPDRRWRTRRVCDWRGHGHHRTRVCRTVRYR